MPSKIIMPQGGQDLTSGRIVRWLKDEGDRVKEGEVVCEVETEKAVFEVSAPAQGYLIKILAHDGEEVEILSTIGYVGEEGEVIDEGQTSELIQKEMPKSINASKDQSSERAEITTEDFIKISPKARLLARENQIDLHAIKSSREDGKITFEDVQKTIEQKAKENRMDTMPVHATSIRPGRIRKAIAKRMHLSWTSAPHIFVTVAVDMTKALVHKKRVQEYDFSITDLVVAACARALRDFSDINASYSDEDTIYLWDDINIGLAVSLDEGLVVAVIEDADRFSLRDLSVQTKDLLERVRQGVQIPSKASRFTISNLGMHNVDQFNAVLNPPEAAILAVSSIRHIPQFNESDQVVACDMMNLTLSLDHRVGDGVLAAKFVNAIKNLLENPEELIR